MFWTQIEESSINDVLLKEDVSLEDVLDHESLLQDCKNQNESLIKFLTESSNYWKLLKYVLITPDDTCDENIRFKYPSLSCEVLTSDIPTLNNMLINGIEISQSGDDDKYSGFEKPYFNQFYNILSVQEVVNPLTMSFCVKILLNILKSDNETVMKLMTEKTDCIDVLLSHIDSNAIVHFFTEFVQCEDDVVNSRKQWLIDNKFIMKVASLLGQTEYKNNSVQLIFYNILWYMSIGLTNKIISTELTEQLNEKEFINLIFAHISNLQSDSSLISTCLKVIRNIIEMEIKEKTNKITYCMELIHKHFHSFIRLLNEPPKQMYDSMPTTVGVFRPFGPTRLDIVNLLESILNVEDNTFNTLIVEYGIVDILLNLVSQYKWNSQFHLSLLRVVTIIFSDLSVGNKCYDIQKHLVCDFHIYNWFLQLQSDLETLTPRPGYSGILWKIGNILEQLKNDELLAGEWLNDLSPLVTEKWKHIVDNYLKPRNAFIEKESTKFDSGLKELDLDLNIVDIDETYIESAVADQDVISDFFRTKSDDLDDIFGVPLIDNTEGTWIVNELEMPNAPIDDFRCHVKAAMDSDDSTSSDEESPIVIRQNPQGNAAKYIYTDSCHNLNDLPEIPDSADVEFANLEFNDPWDKKMPDDLVPNNWAKF